jgi:hypothetical protein
MDSADTSQVPGVAPGEAQDVIDAAMLLRRHLHASTLAATLPASALDVPAGGAPADPGIDQQWRARLSELGQAVGLQEGQEAELERLARAQLDLIREEIPRLLAELKPHFDTPFEAEAKHRYESGLRALRARLDRETGDLLRGLGFDPAQG